MLREIQQQQSKDENLYRKAINSIRTKKDTTQLNQSNKSNSIHTQKDESKNQIHPSNSEIKQAEKESKYHRLMIGISHEINRSLQRQNRQRSDRHIISLLSASQQSHDQPLSKSKKKNIIYMRKNQDKEKAISENTFKTQPQEVKSPINKKKVFYLSINRPHFSKEDSKSQGIYHLPNFDLQDQRCDQKASCTMRYLKECLSKATNKRQKLNLSSPTHQQKHRSNMQHENVNKNSVIPAFPQPTPIKYKQTKPSKDDSIFNQIQEYVMTNKMKEMQRSLVIESRKQEIIKKNAERYIIDPNAKRKYLRTSIQKSHSKQQRVKQNKNDERNKKLNKIELQSKITITNSEVLPFRPKKQVKTTKTFDDFLNYKQNLSVYEQKIKTYRQLLFLVNMAHRVFDPILLTDPSAASKTEKVVLPKYNYYIGPGNNCRLIRALMKRRPWWTECCDLKDAQFVWTQIKVADVLASQSQRDIGLHTYELSSQIPMEKAQMKCSMSLGLSQSISKQYIFKPPFALKDSSKVLTAIDASIYHELLNSLNYNQFDNFQSRIKYLPEHYFTEYKQSKKIIHNHLQFNQSLGNKKALFYHLTLYYKIKGKSSSVAFPQTYHIKSLENDQNYKEFLNEFTRLSKNKSLQNIWIVKPGENSNRGTGIDVFNDARRLKFLVREQKYKDGQSKTYIIQKYIEKPLLYQGRKFDIRHYMIVTSLYGHLRAYWYGEGYIRTSSYPFSLFELEDSMIHLTNDAIQKQSKSYGNHEEGNKISYIELQRYFDKNFPFRRFDFKKIYVKMRDLAKDAINSAYLSLTRSRKMHNFQIFGLDFMVDDHFKVHLIEINTNPCLEISSALLGRIIPLMVEQTFRVALDPIFPPNVHLNNNLKSIAPDCSLEKLQMQLIFDEVQQKPKLQSLYANHKEQYKQMTNNLMGLQQDEQTFDNEGDEVQIDKLII